MSIRKLALLGVVCVVLPLAAWADGFDFQDSSGVITSNGSVLMLHASTLTSLSGLNSMGPVTGNLGLVSFTTGALTSGSLATGGTFAAGGSFTIIGTGNNGLPNGVIFKGAFGSPVTWSAKFVSNAGPNHQGAWYYTLSGTIVGTLSNGQTLSARITFSTDDVPKGQQFSSMANLNAGLGNVLVPEPGTLALLGSGLLGMALLMRRARLATH